ncbi:glycoside hydrolase family 75 protein [Planosporangium mesophilum]|uniref:Uncharacterized protein n=1 Tax=Planosporangium mesophilum TaxID=689768 RepID=A0A8J3X472_9ACTN|nr:glycoside hydrolase family 75 protein [Planosporangium mesophilum]NJC83733.1 hypothetical protein [Planosporangium mesophilum]GII26314.1 hypothetical protein Pme01_59110 [Planosporangium mesophilum]
MRRLRIALLMLGLVSLPMIATPAYATVHAQASPTANQLLAKASSCSVVSQGRYRTVGNATSATVDICGSGSAYFWKADMDIDCDGVSTSNCNSRTDPWYQPQTAYRTSKGGYFQSDATHFFVIPASSSRFSYSSAGIRPGTVAAVIYRGAVVYAVFADVGPSNVIGEASYATARDLGINPDPRYGGVESGVTYIIFKGNVPSPVEDNGAITAKGAAAANAWLNGD